MTDHSDTTPAKILNVLSVQIKSGGYPDNYIDEGLHQLDAYYANLYDQRFREALGEKHPNYMKGHYSRGKNDAIDQATARWEKMKGEA